MMSIRNAMAGASFVAAVLGFLVSAADASPISDSLIVRDHSGAIVASAVLSEADEISGAIITVPVAIDASQFGNATNLIEPHTNGSNGFSDIVGICTCGDNGGLALGFSSDSETQLVNFGLFPRTFPELGPIDVTLYLDPTLQRLGWTATFSSDVPEPITLSLFGAGLAGALSLRRRRKQTPA
jgi:hypothetical protein